MVRGMEMRDKIKLKSKNKNIIKQKDEENSSKNNSFKNEINEPKEINKNNSKYNEIYESLIVNKIYINLLYIYSPKKISKN